MYICNIYLIYTILYVFLFIIFDKYIDGRLKYLIIYLESKIFIKYNIILWK